ncbi:MAG: hypothetical protein ABF750_06615 [Oenococcus oeni]
MTTKNYIKKNNHNDSFKRVKGNRKYFSKLLKGLMDKHNHEIKDLLTPVLGLYEGNSPSDTYQNGISKISNWRVGKTLPSNLELKALRDFYVKQGEHLEYFSMLYPDPLFRYIERFFQDLYHAFKQELFDRRANQPLSYKVLDQKLKSKDIGILIRDFDNLFSQDFSYMRATVSEYETDPETHQLVSEEQLVNFFKEHVLEKPRFVNGFRQYLFSKNFYKFETLSSTLGSLINKYLFAYIEKLTIDADSNIQNELSQLYRNTAQHSPLYDLDQREDLRVKEEQPEINALQKKINDATRDFLSKLEILNKERIDFHID